MPGIDDAQSLPCRPCADRHLRPGGATHASELARTTWHWVGFTTPVETLTITEPESYVLSFADGDRVALRADCNRAAGSVGFPEPGAIRFGVLATTRAICPPGSLGARFASEVVRAGHWAIQRGELRLELSDGAGVLRFTRRW